MFRNLSRYSWCLGVNHKYHLQEMNAAIRFTEDSHRCTQSLAASGALMGFGHVGLSCIYRSIGTVRSLVVSCSQTFSGLVSRTTASSSTIVIRAQLDNEAVSSPLTHDSLEP